MKHGSLPPGSHPHFYYHSRFIAGPVSRSGILHQWGSGYDDLIQPPQGYSSHWGASSVNGQLGGFDLDTLVDLGNGIYEAARFAFQANGGSSIPYSPLELYIMGLIPADQVPDIWVGQGAQYIDEWSYTNPTRRFQVDSSAMITMDDIAFRYGIRIPDFRESQKDFTVFPVFIGTAPPAQNGQMFNELYLFTRPSDDNTPSYNFWEATGGRGTMSLSPMQLLQN